MINPDKRNAIYYLYKESMKIKAISRQLKVSPKTVRNIITQKDKFPKTRKDKIHIDTELLRRLYIESNYYITLLHKKLTTQRKIKIGYSTLTSMIHNLNIKKLWSDTETIRTKNYLINKYILRKELYDCMIKGKLYIDVIKKNLKIITNEYYFPLSEDERLLIIKNGKQGNIKIWRSGVAIEMSGIGLGIKTISKILDIDPKTIKKKIQEYNKSGLENILKCKRNNIKIQEVIKLKTKRILEILHQKPNLFGINRSSWNCVSIIKAYNKLYDEKIGLSTLRLYIKNAGYKMKKAKKVLTSSDPTYREKVELLLKTIQSLKSDELFFFIDELGPLQVKKHGGRCYVKNGEILRLPRIQKLKGSIILSGALSATTNQISWIYRNSKDTTAMIDLIEILFNQYHEKFKIFISWDAA